MCSYERRRRLARTCLGDGSLYDTAKNLSKIYDANNDAWETLSLCCTGTLYQNREVEDPEEFAASSAAFIEEHGDAEIQVSTRTNGRKRIDERIVNQPDRRNRDPLVTQFSYCTANS
jgi:hypothetical protein